MTSRLFSARRIASCQQGFSLVELMVAIVLGLFLVAGLTSLLVSNVRTRSELDKSARQIENGRFALEVLSEDIQHAGFIGTSRASFAAVLPVACATTLADLGYAPAAAPNIASAPASLYGLAAAPACVSDAKANTAIVVATRVSTVPPVAPTAASAAAAAETFLQVSTCDTETTPFAIAKGNGSFPLTRKDCNAANPALVRQVVQHIYFVSTCNVCTGPKADTIPTLKMMEYVGGAMTETPLVEGIEDLQIEYGVDVDGNGSPDWYTSNAGSPPAAEIVGAPTYDWSNPVTNWSNVVTARIHVLARSNDPSGGWIDKRTYDMGWRITGAGTSSSAPVAAFNDAYKRHAYSAVARLNNVSGQRE